MIINPLFVTVKYNPIYVIPRCCICLENVTTNKHQCGVCSHFTHIQCIKKWKKKSKNKRCPTCRSKIKLK